VPGSRPGRHKDLALASIPQEVQYFANELLGILKVDAVTGVRKEDQEGVR
jgi:hypothetical protein